MRRVIAICLLIIVAACSSKKDGNMIVQGKIKGLKKGKLYLQKMKDTVLITVDSVSILGDNYFKLSDNIDAPELFYLTFKGSNAQERILFFGEKGLITINDNIEKFGLNPDISGSKNQEILEKYNFINRKFINERLDFVEKDFTAKKNNDKEMMQQLDVDYKKLEKRRILYTTNFALTNADFEATPYIALTELYNANVTLLDTVNKSLTAKVKSSIYGKSFNDYVTKIKAMEAKK